MPAVEVKIGHRDLFASFEANREEKEETDEKSKSFRRQDSAGEIVDEPPTTTTRARTRAQTQTRRASAGRDHGRRPRGDAREREHAVARGDRARGRGRARRDDAERDAADVAHDVFTARGAIPGRAETTLRRKRKRKRRREKRATSRPRSPRTRTPRSTAAGAASTARTARGRRCPSWGVTSTPPGSRCREKRVFSSSGDSHGVSRSIGDRGAARACVSAPEINNVRIPSGKGARIVVASDGVWDCFASAAAMKKARSFSLHWSPYDRVGVVNAVP